MQHRLEVLRGHLFPKQQESKKFVSPQATAATLKREASTSDSPADYFELNDFLTEDEKKFRLAIRDVANKVIKPKVAEASESGKFAYELLQEVAKVMPGGASVEGYGKQTLMNFAIGIMELSKVDGAFGGICILHSAMVFQVIAACGTEAQKKKYLPEMQTYERLGAFALTEPDVGSDATNIQTTATWNGKEWILNGRKRWIGNAAFSKNVVIVWAKNSETGKVHGFLVENGHPGFRLEVIPNRIGFRVAANTNIFLENCVVTESQRLPGVKDFQTGPGRFLGFSRVFVGWQAVGIAMGAYEAALEYCKKRKQFGKPLASFQLSQNKFFTMLANIQAMTLMCLRGLQLLEKNKISHGQSSMIKAYVSKLGRETTSLARELLGGNGIVRDFGVATHFCDMETLYTFEGAYDINVLHTGREITGLSSFK